MDLKEILGDDLFAKTSASTDETVKAVLAKLGEKKLVVDNGEFLTKKDVGEKFVPRHEFNEKNELAKALRDQISKYEQDMKTLKIATEGNDALTKQIGELQSQAKKAKEEFETSQAKAKADFETHQLKTKKEYALKEALMGAGVGDEKARSLLSKEFELEKLELDDKGTVKGFEDLLKPIKENTAFSSMFGKMKMAGQEHQQGSGSENDYYTKEQLETMTPAEMSANIEKVNKSTEILARKT